MGLKADLRTLNKSWVRQTGYLPFLVEGDFTYPGEPALEDLNAISAGIEEALSQRDIPCMAREWIRTPRGWVAFLLEVRVIDEALEWFELFARTWGDSVQGSICGAPESSGPQLGSVGHQLTSLMLYTTGDLLSVPVDDRGPIWFVDSDTTLDLCERAVAWAYFRGCRQFLDRAWVFEVVDLDHASVMADSMQAGGSCRLSCVDRPGGEHVRKVEFRPHGQAGFQTSNPAESWHERLEQVRETLRWTPAQVDLGYITHLRSNYAIWEPSVHAQPWPHVEGYQVRDSRPLMKNFTPDAYGIQLLTDAHLERTHDLSAWSITEITPGRHLVEHPDLAAWYADPHPDPQLIEQARADFGEAILTPRAIDENPWGDLLR